jgi:hypothetical protein
MKRFTSVIAGLALLFAAHATVAQPRFSVEVDAGAAFATQDLGDANLDVGFGFQGTVGYRFLPHLSAYAGWGWHHFAADESFAGAEVDIEETGYTFGLQFLHPVGASSLAYFVRAGGIYNHLEVENAAGDITADSGHGLGWQVAAGLAIPLGQKWRVMPGVRYQALSRDLEVEGASTAVDLTYFSVGIGFSRLF